MDEIDIDELPELETVVAVFGAAEQQEVGGEICTQIAMATYLFSHS